MKRYDIPLEGNEYYYNGLRNNLLSFCVSLIGVAIYALVKSWPDGMFSNIPAWISMTGLIVLVMIIFFSTKILPSRFYVFNCAKKPIYNARKAAFWNASLQLSTGVFCSFFFDVMFSPVTLRLFITTLIFLSIYGIGMNEFAKNAVKKSIP
jgi:hypothetical protein